MSGIEGLRALMLDRDLFWIVDPMMLGVATLAAVAVFLTAHLLDSRYRAILWLDAFALAVAVPAGVTAALATGQDWPVILVMAMVTGCMVGLLRDVVCNDVPLVLKQGELYVSCAFAGALCVVLAGLIGCEGGLVLFLCAVATFALWAGSTAFGWRLPVYRARPPRTNPPKG